MFRQSTLLLAVITTLMSVNVSTSQAQEKKVQCFMLEYFYDSTAENAESMKAAFEQYGEDHPGLVLYIRDVSADEEKKQRLTQLQDYFKVKDLKLPAVYGLKYFADDLNSAEKLNSKLDDMLTLTAYVRNGCPHCRAAKSFLAKYGSRYPALKIVYREVTTDKTASQEMRDVARRYRQRAASLPLIHYCNGVTVGFSTERTTGVKILKTLDKWSEGCVLEKKN